jgi:hypothetical protein
VSGRFERLAGGRTRKRGKVYDGVNSAESALGQVPDVACDLLVGLFFGAGAFGAVIACVIADNPR